MPTYVLSVPPSVNKMYANRKIKNGGRGRFKTAQYRAWIEGELKALMAQRARPIAGQVSVKIVFPQQGKADLDNRIKPALDLLVRAMVIEDDGPKFVRSLTIDFAPIEGMKISVEPYVQPVRVKA